MPARFTNDESPLAVTGQRASSFSELDARARRARARRRIHACHVVVVLPAQAEQARKAQESEPAKVHPTLIVRRVVGLDRAGRAGARGILRLCTSRDKREGENATRDDLAEFTA